MRTLRIVLVIAVAALFVAVAPGGHNAADAALTALTVGFLSAVGFLVYRMFRENQMTLDSLDDRRRALLYGALGMIALLIAGSSKMFETGAGTLAWVLLFGLSLFAIFRVWVDATRYS
jgi:multisubunit Na+/H+ antiporter MnhB subunit